MTSAPPGCTSHGRLDRRRLFFSAGTASTAQSILRSDEGWICIYGFYSVSCPARPSTADDPAAPPRPGPLQITRLPAMPTRPKATPATTAKSTPPGPETTAALRRAIRRIEEAGPREHPRLPLGIAGIDDRLPGGGLRLGCVHEVTGDEAATAFCALLLSRARRCPVANAGSGSVESAAVGSGPESRARDGPRTRRSPASPGALLWISRGNDLHAPGLVRYGIGPGQLVVVSGLHRRHDALWAMEEALRCRAMTGVVAEVEGIGLAAGRRLMLAAEGRGVLGLVLSRREGAAGGEREAGRGGVAGMRGAVSRWRVRSRPGEVGGGGNGVRRRTPTVHTPTVQGTREGTKTRWRIELLHCRGGRPAEWSVGREAGEWRAQPLPTRAARPKMRRAG